MISLVKIRRVSSVSLPLSASFPLSAVRLADVMVVVILQESVTIQTSLFQGLCVSHEVNVAR